MDHEKIKVRVEIKTEGDDVTYHDTYYFDKEHEAEEFILDCDDIDKDLGLGAGDNYYL